MTDSVKHVFWPFCPFCAQNYSGWPHFLADDRASWCHAMWSCLLSVSNALSTAYLFLKQMTLFVVLLENLENERRYTLLLYLITNTTNRIYGNFTKLWCICWQLWWCPLATNITKKNQCRTNLKPVVLLFWILGTLGFLTVYVANSTMVA